MSRLSTLIDDALCAIYRRRRGVPDDCEVWRVRQHGKARRRYLVLAPMSALEVDAGTAISVLRASGHHGRADNKLRELFAYTHDLAGFEVGGLNILSLRAAFGVWVLVTLRSRVAELDGAEVEL